METCEDAYLSQWLPILLALGASQDSICWVASLFPCHPERGTMSPHDSPNTAGVAPSLCALSICLVLCGPPAWAQSTPPPVTPENGAATAQRRPAMCSEPRTGPADATGCYLISTEPIGAAPATPLFWHIDEFPTRSAAEAARQARGTVGEAHGRAWLLTVAGADWKPASGKRVARVGPLPVTAGREYT